MEVKGTLRESAPGRGAHPLALPLKIFCLWAAIVALLTGVGERRLFGSGSSDIAIFYTNDVAGYLEPCG